jgi:ribulose-phosphate 3-epimerase
MLKVIPAINADSFEEVKKRIKLVEPLMDSAKGGVNWVQLDVADGTFTKNTIWHNAVDLLGLDTPLNIEVHLMIDKIEDRIKNWLIAPVKRVIFHLEAGKDPYFVMQKCQEAGKEVGISIGPDTPWTQLVPFCDKVDLFQILAVYPGLAGQEFQEESLEKISALRKNCPSAIIEVDGGVEAGGNIINAASYIFNSDNIRKAIEELVEPATLARQN